MLKLKKGALVAERTIKPFVMKYNTGGSSSLEFAIMPLLALIVMNMCFCGCSCDVIEMPIFQANEYLFETHKDKGKERWEILAWAIREIICDVGGLIKCDTSLKEKLTYEEHMQMNPKYPSPYVEKQPETTEIDEEKVLK